MVCLGCQRPTAAAVCRICFDSLRPSPRRVLPTGIPVVAAFEHEGVARRLVHQLKYQGVVAVAGLVAEMVAPDVPELPLVPVPRAMSRRFRYGVDPALELARAIAVRAGVPVVNGLISPIHSRRRAGHNRNRPPHAYRARPFLPGAFVLVDDVLTTGATVLSAAFAVGPQRVHIVVTASAVAGVSNLQQQVTSPTKGRV